MVGLGGIGYREGKRDIHIDKNSFEQVYADVDVDLTFIQ